MSDMRLKMVPAALAAVGMLTAGINMSVATPYYVGVPAAAVYTNSLFAPTAFIQLGWHADIPLPSGTVPSGTAVSTTSGLIAVVLRGNQTGWGFHLSDSNYSPSARGTHTLTSTYAPSTTSSATCTLDMVVDYDMTTQIMGVSFSTPVASTTSVSTACQSRYATVTGLSTSVFGGAKQNFQLLY